MLIVAEVAIPVDSVSAAGQTPAWAVGTGIADHLLGMRRELVEAAGSLADMAHIGCRVVAAQMDTVVDRAAGIAAVADCV